jgi:hypothetical protein
MFKSIGNWFKKVFKKEGLSAGHYSLSSAPNIKLKDLPEQVAPVGSYWKPDRRNLCYEVIESKKDTIVVSDLQTGNELKFHKETFLAMFVEVGRFPPQKK